MTQVCCLGEISLLIKVVATGVYHNDKFTYPPNFKFMRVF